MTGAGIAADAVGRIARGKLYPDRVALARLATAAQEPTYPRTTRADAGNAARVEDPVLNADPADTGESR